MCDPVVNFFDFNGQSPYNCLFFIIQMFNKRSILAIFSIWKNHIQIFCFPLEEHNNNNNNNNNNTTTTTTTTNNNNNNNGNSQKTPLETRKWSSESHRWTAPPKVSALQEGPSVRLWDLTSRRVLQRYLGHFQAPIFFWGEERWETCVSLVLRPKKVGLCLCVSKTILSMVGLFGRRWGETIFTTFLAFFWFHYHLGKIFLKIFQSEIVYLHK